MTKAYSYIRMSTTAQLDGDSLRRQRALAEGAATKLGLSLQDELSFEDIGVSAYDGTNKRKGGFGQFLQAAARGEIEQGSYLIVESLDRMSRENVQIALLQFLQLLQTGINIITLHDNKIYTRDNHNDLFFSIVVMSRAHEESLIKSLRIKAAWEQKRKNAHKKKMTARAPLWLKISADRNEFYVIEERAAVIREIFDLTLSGMGAYAISRKLNERCTPTFGKSIGWQTSYVKKILSNDAVYGKYKFFRGKNNKEEMVVDNYFPTVVEQSVFERARLIMSERRNKGGGRKGKSLSNIFTKIAHCGYCGSKMHYINKGGKSRNLVCDGYRRALCDESANWRYQDFEISFLLFVNDLNLEQIAKLGVSDSASELENLREQILQTNAAINAEKIRINNLVEYIATGNVSIAVKDGIEASERKLDSLELLLNSLYKVEQNLRATSLNASKSVRALRPLVQKLQNQEVENIFELRSSIAQSIKDIVESIHIFASGSEGQHVTKEQFDLDQESALNPNFPHIDRITPYHLPHFWVNFRNKTNVAIIPEPNNCSILRFSSDGRYGGFAARKLFGLELLDEDIVTIGLGDGKQINF